MNLLRTTIRVRNFGTARRRSSARIGYRTSKISRQTARPRRTQANNQPSFKRFGL